MRVQPKWFVGVLVLVAYMALVSGLWTVFAVDYATVGDTTGNIVKGIVVPIGIGGLFLAGLTSWFGWWRPALRERPVVAPKWTLVVPVLLVLTLLLNIAVVDYGQLSAGYFAVLALGVGLVGFSEELLCRGLVVLGLRGSVSEVWVWFGSCVLFGLLHSINALFGQGLPETTVQIVMTFFAGSAFYVIRMATGTLVVAMVLHAAWDFGTLGISATDGAPSGFAVLGMFLTFLLALVAGVVVARAKKRAVSAAAA